MIRHVSFSGFFPTAESSGWRAITDTIASRQSLPFSPSQSGERDATYGGEDGAPMVAARLSDGPWSDFGVFGMTPSFVTQSGDRQIAEWLLDFAEGLHAALGRTYQSATVPMLEEVIMGPDCLHWLQYFGRDIGQRWSVESLRNGPFHHMWQMGSGAIGLSLGPSPFGELKSIKAAAAHLGIPLRPLMGKNMKGERIEMNWP